ncbi:hypothetical protein HUN41_00204 [Streptomyces phage Coruscant]|uniref:Uncharacterized protein n=1 Tax=Streptomyces phage Coruscant TaxID=2739834 RepID=A0A7G4AWA7_9CAUD|nr:hypothetical protein PP454_gp120 [Streptomyces phage Coruscant]QMP84297.1 hypothetical protein HUN41_00204 [Streptomyces phage Coruscant]
MRPATAGEYVIWLKGHLAAGGEITHNYDYPFARWGFMVATSHFTLKPGYGSRSKRIIVPRYIKWAGQLGHDNVFEMNDYRHHGHLVPTFSDPEFLF